MCDFVDVDPSTSIIARRGVALSTSWAPHKQSGFGISPRTNVRELLAAADEHDDRRAPWRSTSSAIARRKYVGAYLAARMAPTHCLQPAASAITHRDSHAICSVCGRCVELDPARNGATVGGAEGRVSTDGSRIEVWVVPTDEELLIARDAVRVVQGLESRY